MSRIVQVANFVAPHSGGIRTVLDNLASGYAAAGHEVVQVVPGPARRTAETAWGRREVLHGWPVPRTGYRLLAPAAVQQAIESNTDRVEVHDRTTLRGIGRWARERGIGSVVVSHERLDRVLPQWVPPAVPLTALADRSNAALAAGYDSVVCTTSWAATEFERLAGVRPHLVPLGVDVARFSPSHADPELRARVCADGEALLVMASRLSREKHPELALRAVEVLHNHGVDVQLIVAGDGPMRAALRAQAAAQKLPARFVGYLPQEELARWLASADVVLAPGPIETFCLAALEALACGTPVVCNAASAVPEILGPAGMAAAGEPRAFAEAVEAVLRRPAGLMRATARQQALRYGWTATVQAMLAVHGLAESPALLG